MLSPKQNDTVHRLGKESVRGLGKLRVRLLRGYKNKGWLGIITEGRTQAVEGMLVVYEEK